MQVDLFGLTGEWSVVIHDRGHYIHNAMYKYGNAYTYTMLNPGKESMTVNEIHMKEVTYINDERTPCQSTPRTEEINTCIQRHIENEMECQLPWHNEVTSLPRCSASDKYEEFLNSYIRIKSLSEEQISNETGCLPSCQRNEFEVLVNNHFRRPTSDGKASYSGLFYYPSGEFRKKTYFYVYDFGDYIGDVGGYLGLLLGYSMLTFYDGFKYMYMLMPTLTAKRSAVGNISPAGRKQITGSGVLFPTGSW